MTLVSAILVLNLLTVTTLAFLTLSASEPQIANNHLRSSQAFYIAESGLEIGLAHLNNEGPPVLVQAGPVGAGTYTLTLTPVGLPLPGIGPIMVRAHSVGQVGPATRAVSNVFMRDLEGRWAPLPQFREESAP
jgi:hypothetical protein